MCDSITCIAISPSAPLLLAQATVKRSGEHIHFLRTKTQVPPRLASPNQQTPAPTNCLLFQHEGLGSCQARSLLQVSRRVLEIMGVIPCDMALTASTNRGCGFPPPALGTVPHSHGLLCQNAGLVSRRLLSRLLYFVVKHLLGAPRAHPFLTSHLACVCQAEDSTLSIFKGFASLFNSATAPNHS